MPIELVNYLLIGAFAIGYILGAAAQRLRK